MAPTGSQAEGLKIWAGPRWASPESVRGVPVGSMSFAGAPTMPCGIPGTQVEPGMVSRAWVECCSDRLPVRLFHQGQHFFELVGSCLFEQLEKNHFCGYNLCSSRAHSFQAQVIAQGVARGNGVGSDNYPDP